jgi:hypothetical protein
MIAVLVVPRGMIWSISFSNSWTLATCALAMKQSSPVMRSHSTMAGSLLSNAASLPSWPGIGRTRMCTANGSPSAAGLILVLTMLDM